MKGADHTRVQPLIATDEAPTTIIELHMHRSASRRAVGIIVAMSVITLTALVVLFMRDYRAGTVVSCVLGIALGVLPTLYAWRGHPKAGPRAILGIACGLILITVALWLYILVAGVPMAGVAALV